MNSTYRELCSNLDRLGLQQMRCHLDEVSALVAGSGLSFSDGLLRLSNYEVDFKEANASASLVKAAAFPHLNTVESFDFDFQPSVNRELIMELCSMGFVEKHENIVFLGPSGVGKTHLATAIGIAAATQHIRTYFIKCSDLLLQLRRAKIENRLESRFRFFKSIGVLVIDELGYLPIDKDDSSLFFQLIDMRYEKRSTIITTNIGFSEWDSIFNDVMVANAILDRVLHHSHVINISGRSYRLKDHIKPSD